MSTGTDLQSPILNKFLTDIFNAVVDYRNYCALHLQSDISDGALIRSDDPTTVTFQDDNIVDLRPQRTELTESEKFRLNAIPFYMNVTTRLTSILAWSLEVKAARAGEKTLTEALNDAAFSDDMLETICKEDLDMRAAAPERLAGYDASSIGIVRQALLMNNMLREQAGLDPIELPENMTDTNDTAKNLTDMRPKGPENGPK